MYYVNVHVLTCVFLAVSGFGLDYLPAAASSAASDTSWHQSGPTGSSWTNQESPMEESSSTVLLDSLKVGKCFPNTFNCRVLDMQ